MCGDAHLAAVVRERAHVDLPDSGRVRAVRDPAAVGREGGIGFVDVGAEETRGLAGLQAAGAARQRGGPQVEAARRAHLMEREPRAVGRERPRHARIVAAEQQLAGVRRIRRDGNDAAFGRALIQEETPIGRPRGRALAARGRRDAAACAGREIVRPDVVVAVFEQRHRHAPAVGCDARPEVAAGLRHRGHRRRRRAVEPHHSRQAAAASALINERAVVRDGELCKAEARRRDDAVEDARGRAGECQRRDVEWRREQSAAINVQQVPARQVAAVGSVRQELARACRRRAAPHARRSQLPRAFA